MRVFAGSGWEGYEDGVGPSANFYCPEWLAIDQQTGTLFVSDLYMIRKITHQGELNGFNHALPLITTIANLNDQERYQRLQVVLKLATKMERGVQQHSIALWEYATMRQLRVLLCVILVTTDSEGCN